MPFARTNYISRQSSVIDRPVYIILKLNNPLYALLAASSTLFNLSINVNLIHSLTGMSWSCDSFIQYLYIPQFTSYYEWHVIYLLHEDMQLSDMNLNLLSTNIEWEGNVNPM